MARARYGSRGRRQSSRRWAGGQTSRTLRATAIPIATRISKTSSFFTTDLLVDGRCPDGSETGRPAPGGERGLVAPLVFKTSGTGDPRPVGSIPATSAEPETKGANDHGAGASLAQVGASGGEAAVGLIVFVVIASVTIATPVVFSLVGGERAAHVLDGWRVWLAAHNTAMMAVLFLVFGAVLFSQGLRGLT
jgi:hypothetical protein